MENLCMSIRVNFAKPEIALNRKFYKKMASWIRRKLRKRSLCDKDKRTIIIAVLWYKSWKKFCN